MKRLLAIAFLVVACGGSGATATSSQPPPSVAPSATPGVQTPYDGVWASKPLTRADLAAALERRGLSAARLDEAFGDWDKVDYRIFEIEVRNGRWLQDEIAEGVNVGGWTGDIVRADADAVVVANDTSRCAVTFDTNRRGDALSVRVADDACPDPGDLPLQVAMYESSTFRLVQAADWTPPKLAPVASASSTAAPASSEASTSSAREKLRPIGTVDGAPLGYLEYLPPDYGKRPSPLLVFLHGSGESGAGTELALNDLKATGIPSLISDDRWPDSRPFVVLAPQHNAEPPSLCMEAREIDAFLRFALEHYDVDPARVYVTGLSCGAIGLWNYLAAHGDELVAAAVPIAGYGIGAVELAGCDLALLPIWAFHGSADESVAVRGDVYPLTQLQACTDPAPADARLTVYPDQSHDVWTETYGASRYDIYGWLLGHHK